MAILLCIDDNKKVLEVGRALLESKGYSVLTAQNGRTGIALARKHSMDAVIVDFNMPGMDSNQVAKVLKKENTDLPIVIWSGCLDELPGSTKWFADAVLDKGDGRETLLALIERLVNAGQRSKKILARRIVRRKRAA
jgi:CheY-like chemotaxis protein